MRLTLESNEAENTVESLPAEKQEMKVAFHDTQNSDVTERTRQQHGRSETGDSPFQWSSVDGF